MSNEPRPQDEFEVEPAEPLPEDFYAPDPLKPTINELWEQSLREQEIDVTRFTVADLGIAIAAASVLLAFARFLPIDYAAAALGIVVLVGGCVLSLRSLLPRAAILSWWVLLGLYLSFSLVAMVTQ